MEYSKLINDFSIKDLVSAAKNLLDKDVIRQIFEKEHGLEIGDEITCKDVDLVTHGDQVACKLQLEIVLSHSILASADGTYIPAKATPEESIEEMGSEAEDIVRGIGIQKLR